MAGPDEELSGSGTDVPELVGGDDQLLGTVAVGALAVEADRHIGDGMLLGGVLDPLVGFAEQDLVQRETLLARVHTTHPTGYPAPSD